MNEQLEQIVLSDLAQLEMVLAADTRGERARQMIAYYAQVVEESIPLLQKSQEPVERQLVQQLIDAFHASQRVIRQVWEQQHTTELAA
jgi:uncharacterized protein (DUF305 family)